jgi:lysylphosphatidylglycerol synthetase-like protein (DUF2156 family)
MKIFACVFGVAACLVAGAGFAVADKAEWMAASFFAAFLLMLAIARLLED